MTIRKIVVLGGSGFVGSHLCARLVREGYQIKALSRQTARARHLLVLPTLDLVAANVHDPKTLQREFAGCDAVINLVGTLNERGHRGKGFYKVHTELAQKIIKACRQAGVKRLLQMSALGVAENAPSHYLRSKCEAENAIRSGAGDAVHYTFYRPSVIFGTNDSFTNRFAGLLKFTPGILPLACADAKFAPVYVGDVVDAFARGLTDRSTWNQGYELCGPRVYTLAEIVRYIADVMERRCWIIKLPNWLSRLQAAVLEFFPGKPLSLDNYHSLQIDSVCQDDGCQRLDIAPTRLQTIVPTYLAPPNRGRQINHVP